jgi:hypothetical protein
VTDVNRTRTAAVVAALALVGLLVSSAVAWSRLGPGSTVREPEPGPAVAVKRTVAPEDAPQVGRSDATLGPAERPGGSESLPTAPVRVTLPSVGVDARVRPVGVAADGQMEIPADPRELGWYEFGPTPGDDAGGSVVVAGHLDSDRFGLGPLVRLRDIRPGDTVGVRLADGTTATYQVRGIERFDRAALPERIFSRGGPERLRIVTCGGEYDAAAGGYQQNLVVTAEPARS